MAASLQFVRKISGSIAHQGQQRGGPFCGRGNCRSLCPVPKSLATSSPPKDREAETARLRLGAQIGSPGAGARVAPQQKQRGSQIPPDMWDYE